MAGSWTRDLLSQVWRSIHYNTKPPLIFDEFVISKTRLMMWLMCSYEALIDGLRQGPSSFASLVYHSQLAYDFLAMDGRPRAVRFRLIPSHDHHRHNKVTTYHDMLENIKNIENNI